MQLRLELVPQRFIEGLSVFLTPGNEELIMTQVESVEVGLRRGAVAEELKAQVIRGVHKPGQSRWAATRETIEQGIWRFYACRGNGYPMRVGHFSEWGAS